MTSLIDTHVHFDDDRFNPDRDAVYSRAQTAGIDTLIVPATTKDRWQTIFDLSTQYKGVYPTAGLHPVFIDQHTEDHLAELPIALIKGNCVALGECGLDGFYKDLNYEKQVHFFNQQLLISADSKLPVIIHARNAVQDVIQSIKSFGVKTTGVVHSYNGSLEQANQLINLGYLLSFGGAVTYDRATRLRKLIKDLPLESIMVETDAPDQPPSLHYSKRNEPAFITDVVTTIASLKDTTPDVVAQQSNTNAKKLFKIE